METTHDANPAWPSKRRPSRLDTQEDQGHLELGVLHDFKIALQTHQSLGTGPDFFRGAPEDLISRLRGDGVEPSFPLNLFNTLEGQLPSVDEVDTLRHAFLTLFQPKCLFLHNLSPDLFRRHPKYLSLSIASLGAITLSNASRGQTIWNLACKTLMATLSMDNRQTRNADVPLAWLLLGTVGVLSSDAHVWHITNNIHGCLEAIVKKTWADGGDMAVDGNPVTKDRSCVIFYLVLIDTLRSLHLGMAASSMSSFSQIPLEASQGSLSSLLSRTFFAGPQAEWPHFTQDHALLMIILILNQILAFVREMSPLAQACAPTSDPTTSYSRFSIVNETGKCLIRIERALDKWEECYMHEALPQTQALLFFCRMHLCAPRLHWVALHTQYEPLTGFLAMPPAHVSRQVEKDTNTLAAAAHYAWLVLEHVSEPVDATAVWLPIVLYFAGLIVWRNITFQGLSRSHGSLRVLQLFIEKLRCMPWPCCAAFAQHLDNLAKP